MGLILGTLPGREGGLPMGNIKCLQVLSTLKLIYSGFGDFSL